MPRFIPLFVAVLCSALLSPSSANAGKYNSKLDIGDKAPMWTDLPNVDGTKHSLSDLAKRDVVVVVFTCNSCGYSRDYEQRINAFTKEHATGEDAKVAVVAINVNKVAEDLPPAMKARAEQEGFLFPYLYDESQKIAKDFGAIYTPTFFVLDRERRVVYMGPMDDASEAKNVQTQYVADAVTATLAGKEPAVTEKASIGCRVRFDDGRRRRGRRPGDLKPEPMREPLPGGDSE